MSAAEIVAGVATPLEVVLGGGRSVVVSELRDVNGLLRVDLSLLRDGEDPDDVIRHVVRAYGIKELALRVHVQPQNIARILRAPARAKDSTLKRLLRPFGMKVERRLALV